MNFILWWLLIGGLTSAGFLCWAWYNDPLEKLTLKGLLVGTGYFLLGVICGPLTFAFLVCFAISEMGDTVLWESATSKKNRESNDSENRED